jgi:hypothetical protein
VISGFSVKNFPLHFALDFFGRQFEVEYFQLDLLVVREFETRRVRIFGADRVGSTTSIERMMAFTLWGAFQHFEEETRGSLKNGQAGRREQ